MAKTPSDNEVKLQFVAALDAWVKLEHAMGKVFYVLLKPIRFPVSQSLFQAINGFQAQREAISAVAEHRLSGDLLLGDLDRLLGRGRSLGTKRNRIVHGRWRHFRPNPESPQPRQLMRIYIPANMGPLTDPDSTVWSLKGKYTFLIDDLKRCEQEFTALADDCDAIRGRIAEALGVSPHIQISDEEVLQPSDPAHPPSGHPPKTPGPDPSSPE